MKLKHRITGTILAIAFATTTALPAATIPNLKNPPKAVTASRLPAAITRVPAPPKAPAAPKIPTVKAPSIPKIVSAPKIPAVKAPSVPKIVSAPKVPVVKAPVAPRIPSMKAPITPVVTKVPVNATRLPKAATSPKTPASTPKLVEVSAKTKATRLTTAVPVEKKSVAEVNVIRQIIRDVQKENTKAPKTGAEPDVPHKGKFPTRSNPLDRPSLGGSDTNSIAETLFGVKTGKGGSTKGIFDGLFPDRETPKLKPIDTKKEFDQGFGKKRDLAEVRAAAESIGIATDNTAPENSNGDLGSALGANDTTRGVDQPGKGNKNSNPVNLLTGGEGAGDGLASAGPSSEKATKGVASQGMGAVSDGANDKKTASSDAKKNEEAVNSGRSIAEDAVAINTAAKTMGKLPLTAIMGGGGAGIVAIGEAANGVAAAFSLGTTIGSLIDAGYSAATGSSIGADWAFVDEYYGFGVGQALFNQPDPENQGTPKFGLYDLSPGILQHVGQASSGLKGSQGGSADATPVDEGITGGTPVGAPAGTVIVDKKNGLIGNPVRSGMREGGAGASGPNFNGDAGQINVGPDGVVHQDGSGREIDPLAGMGNGASEPPTNLGGGRTVSTNNNDEDDSSSSDASGATTTTTQTAAKKKK
jgi:hypothetical protein